MPYLVIAVVVTVVMVAVIAVTHIALAVLIVFVSAREFLGWGFEIEGVAIGGLEGDLDGCLLYTSDAADD